MKPKNPNAQALGRIKSPAKSQASRENGRKGGRTPGGWEPLTTAPVVGAITILLLDRNRSYTTKELNLGTGDTYKPEKGFTVRGWKWTKQEGKK